MRPAPRQLVGIVLAVGTAVCGATLLFSACSSTEQGTVDHASGASAGPVTCAGNGRSTRAAGRSNGRTASEQGGRGGTRGEVLGGEARVS